MCKRNVRLNALGVQGGMYVLQMLDNFNSSFPMLAVAILECLTFAWFYGTYNRRVFCIRRIIFL